MVLTASLIVLEQQLAQGVGATEPQQRQCCKKVSTDAETTTKTTTTKIGGQSRALDVDQDQVPPPGRKRVGRVGGRVVEDVCHDKVGVRGPPPQGQRASRPRLKQY